jgi:hypothetical protein
MGDLHAELCERGERWLRSRGCRVVLRDPFKAAVCTGECPDVIGWRDGHSILIECKASRSDFLADRKKKFRENPELGMGDARLFLAPEGVIAAEDLPPGWGLLVTIGKSIKVASTYPRTYRVPSFWDKTREVSGIDFRPLPFTGNKQCETVMLVSALARKTATPTPDAAIADAEAAIAIQQAGGGDSNG